MDLIRTVERLMAPLRRRVMLMVGRAVLRRPPDDSTARQLLQVEGLAGEVLDGVERMQEYGFTSVPPEGAEVLLVAPGGMRQHPIAVAVEDARRRPTGSGAGTVIVYGARDGDAEGVARQRLMLPSGSSTDRQQRLTLVSRSARDTDDVSLVICRHYSGVPQALARASDGSRRADVIVTPTSITLSTGTGRAQIILSDDTIELRGGSTVMRVAPEASSG